MVTGSQDSAGGKCLGAIPNGVRPLGFISLFMDATSGVRGAAWLWPAGG